MSQNFYITQEQFDAIEAVHNPTSANRSEMYQLIYEALQGESARTADDGSVVLADGNLQAWFGAAVETNSRVGAASTLIRNYT